MNTTRSPLGDLGKLPAELRSMIYNFALTTDNPVEISRFRQLRKNDGQKQDKAVTYLTNMYEYGPKSTILTWHGKQKRKMPAIKVLGLNLLLASKTVRGESLPILYGANTFKFDSAWAVEAFLVHIGNRAPMLKDIDLPIAEASATNDKLGILRRVSDPTRMVLRVQTDHDRGHSNALGVSYAIRKFTGVKEYCDGWTQGYTREYLDLDSQLRRFDVMEFEIGVACKFGGEDGVDPYTIEDPVERARKFKEMVREMLIDRVQKEAAWAKDFAKRWVYDL